MHINSTAPAKEETPQSQNTTTMEAKRNPGAPASPDDHTSNSLQTIRLLLVLCLAALSSFSLIPSLQTLLPPPPSVIPPQGNHTIYIDGTCTTQPQSIQYVQHTSNNQKLPSMWSAAKKNSQQFALAQACAAAFAISYETFNINNFDSLTSSTSMLSATGKQHFFQGTTQEPKAPYLTPSWQETAQKEQLQQDAQALNTAQLQQVQDSSNTFSATFIVKYQLTTKIAGKSSTKQAQMSVTVQAIPVPPTTTPTPTKAATNSKTKSAEAAVPGAKITPTPTPTLLAISTGWEVTDWHDISS
jgi:hypothetical protein